MLSAIRLGDASEGGCLSETCARIISPQLIHLALAFLMLDHKRRDSETLSPQSWMRFRRQGRAHEALRVIGQPFIPSQ
jgi:hypothetical protein